MTAPFETRPTGTAVAKKAWRSVSEAFGRMKPLFLSAMTISLALGFATFYVPYFQLYVFKSQALTPVSSAFAIFMVVDIASILIWTAVAAPVAVAMHRFILLGQITPGLLSFGPRYTKTFLLWAMGIQVVWSLVNALSLLIFEGKSLVGALMASIFGILILIVSIHLAMIFPAIATEVRTERWQGRIFNSWKQMTGHSWLLVRTMFVAFLPWAMVYIVFWIFFGGLRASQHHGDLQYSSRFGLALIFGGARIPFIMLGAATVSWLYVWIQQQADPALEPTADVASN